MRRNILRLFGGIFWIALSVLAGCATTPPAPIRRIHVTKTEVIAARTASFKCLKRSEQALDDGITPANVVGHQIGLMCSAKMFRAEVLDVERNNPGSTQEQIGADLISGFPEIRDEEATDIVLLWRKHKAREAAEKKSLASRMPRMNAAMRCLAKQVVAHDDGATAPNIIAADIEPTCKSQLLAWAEAYTPDRSPAAIRKIHQVANLAGNRIAADFILRYRRGGAVALKYWLELK